MSQHRKAVATQLYSLNWVGLLKFNFGAIKTYSKHWFETQNARTLRPVQVKKKMTNCGLPEEMGFVNF